MGIKIIHGIYSGEDSEICLEAKSFENYILEKYTKFNEKYGLEILVYSIGVDNNIKAIAIVHPFDTFDPAVATQILVGRIYRMKGNLQFIDDDGVIHRKPYDPLPDYIEVSE